MNSTVTICYHPRSCTPCASRGAACGRHDSTDEGHTGCTGWDVTAMTALMAAQVAVEAVANDPAAYDTTTRQLVLANGEAHGVAEFYLSMIRGEF